MPVQITTQDLQYLRGMVRQSLLGNPTEYDAYGVITEALILHKQPQNRYTLFPLSNLAPLQRRNFAPVATNQTIVVTG